LGRSFGEEGGIDSILDRSANCNTEFIDFPLRSIKANKETNSNKHNSFKKCNKNTLSVLERSKSTFLNWKHLEFLFLYIPLII